MKIILSSIYVFTLSVSCCYSQGDLSADLKDLIQDSLNTKYEFTSHLNDGVYIKDDVVHIFIDQNCNKIDNTKIPTTLKEEKKYKYKVVLFADDSTYDRENFKINIDGAEFRSENTLSIFYTGSEKIADEKSKLLIIESNTFGPFSDYVKFIVRREDDEAISTCTKTINLESSRPYHVAILGGFYYSSLNDPQNVVQGIIPNSTDSTLYADNPKSQRALTVMAVFYPRPRDPNYVHKELDFMQKWGVAFGIKISENVFDDLLLGLNYEFSKGGSFTVGTHYGKHNAVRGYDNFKFGETPYSGTFSNDQLSEVWDFGFFAGITIDLRILGALRRNVKNERQANADANSTPSNSNSDNQ